MCDDERQKLRKHSTNRYYSMSQEDRQKMIEYMKGFMKKYKKTQLCRVLVLSFLVRSFILVVENTAISDIKRNITFWRYNINAPTKILTPQQKYSITFFSPIKKIFFSQNDIREMVKQFLKFSGDETEKQKFHFPKNRITIDDVEINKMIISDAPHMTKIKTDASFSSDTKMIKELDHHELCSQKQMSMSFVSKNPNTCLFKKNVLLEKHN